MFWSVLSLLITYADCALDVLVCVKELIFSIVLVDDFHLSLPHINLAGKQLSAQNKKARINQK